MLINAFEKLQSIKKEDLLNCIQNENNKIDFVGVDLDSMLNPIISLKNKKIKAITFPFSKEIKALAGNEDLLNIDIIGYYDVRQSGNVGFAVNDILKYCDNCKKNT